MTLTDTPTHSHGLLPTGSPAERFTSRDPEAFELPSGRDEAWRFTPLAKIRRFFEPFVPDGVIDGTNHVPAGAQVDVVTPSSLRSFGAALVPADRVSALAMQRASQGLHVQVQAGADVVEPIVLERIGVGGSAYVHHVVDIGPNARATVVFDHLGMIEVAANVEVVLGDGASLQLVSINDRDPGSIELTAYAASVGRDATYRFVNVALGGEVVIMRSPDVGGFLSLVQERRVTHTFLPPTLVYMVLDSPELDRTDLSSLRCFWYGAAPMSATRLEEALLRIGPVMAQLFGQTEAPMMISTMSPRDHYYDDGRIARDRLSSAGRPAPLVTVAVMAADGRILPAGERGEIVVRSSLVMRGYHHDPAATAAASRHGWHHTGDIGYLDEDNWLFIVDRAKDMVITGGFNVYSTEVEQAVMQHPAVADCAVVGLPDEKWGERVTAVVQLRAGSRLDPAELTAFVKDRLGSVKAPKQVEVWADLPRSKVGKILKTDIKQQLQESATTSTSNPAGSAR